MSQPFQVEVDLDDDYSFDLPFEEEDFEALGIDPGSPTPARPGSEEKVTMLAARYAVGLPLWNESDCYDHGPAEAVLQGPDLGDDDDYEDEEEEEE